MAKVGSIIRPVRRLGKGASASGDERRWVDERQGAEGPGVDKEALCWTCHLQDVTVGNPGPAEAEKPVAAGTVLQGTAVAAASWVTKLIFTLIAHRLPNCRHVAG